MYLNEDKLAQWVVSKNGLAFTRSFSNINTFNLQSQTKPFISIITGYDKIINFFFNKVLSKSPVKILLIIIESDIININPILLNHPNLLHCFSWNKNLKHPKLSALPIGLNFKRHYNSIQSWLSQNNINESDIYNKSKLLCYNCSLNTDSERKLLFDVVNKNLTNSCDSLPYIPPITSIAIPSFIEGHIKCDITNPTCYDSWREYKFILSPRGAGIDCHRTWEALIIGCIPIVLSSNLNELYTDLPVLVINSWSELNENFLNNKYNEILNNKKENKYNYNKLYLNFWTNLFENMIMSNIESNSIISSNFQSLEKPNILINHKIHFITYANQKFQKAKERILQEAHNFGEFETITGYGPEDLPKDFVEKYNDILKMKRGGGYWIWKIAIIKDILNKINDNDFIVYLDSGSKLNNRGKKRFYEYFQMFENNNFGILSMQMTGNKGPGTFCLERKFTTRQIFDYFNVPLDSPIAMSAQFHATLLILRKNNHCMKFINEFEACLDSNKYLITDMYNRISQDRIFIDNRHDQSISSIIRKKIGTIVIDGDETWMQPLGEGISLNYPFWATRSQT